MRIGLDARAIYRPTRRGTGKNLVDLYTHLAAARPDWKVFAYHRQAEHLDQTLPSSSVEPRRIELPGDRLDAWERWRLPLAAWRDRADVLHSPANTCPAWMPLPTVVTIHDLIPIDMPQGRPPGQVHRFEQSVHLACDKAAWIICPSTYTRDRLVSEFDADPDRITVNPWAPDSSMRTIPDVRATRVARRYGVDGPFVLHFGAAAPRKNTTRLIEAWAMTNPGFDHGWKLLIVGLDPATQASLEREVERFSIQDNVVLHGFADESDLPALLSAAGLLAYPSLSEGFGLPILDAWATETAVLTSDRTSLPEVAGDAAMTIDPTDTSGLSRSLLMAIQTPAIRKKLVERGRQRLGRYNWRRTVETFANVIELTAGASRTRSKVAA